MSREELAGSGLLEDLEGLNKSMSSGSWLGTGLSGLAVAGDVAGLIVDPIGTLISWGASFLMEHFEPLKGWLDDLAGNGDAVQADGQSWLACAAAVAQHADELESRTQALLGECEGLTASTYRSRSASTVSALRSGAQALEAVATAYSILSGVVSAVHDLVRDALAEIIGTLASAIIEIVGTAGVASGAVVAQIQIKVGASVTSLTDTVTGVVTSSKNLVSHMHDARGVLESITHLLKSPSTSLAAVIPAGMRVRRTKNGLDVVERGRFTNTYADAAYTAQVLDELSTIRQVNLTTARELQPSLAKRLARYDLPPSAGNADQIQRTLWRLREHGVDESELIQIQQMSSGLTSSRNGARYAAERMGHAGLDHAWHEQGIYNLGLGGPGTGAGHLDNFAIHYSGTEFHIGESKGGGARIGTYSVDGVRVRQGSAAYIGDRLGTDTSFHELMSMNQDVWHDIKTGRITLHSDVSFTRTADPEKIRFTTTQITLAPHHMDNIDAKIAARTDAAERGDTPWIRHG